MKNLKILLLALVAFFSLQMLKGQASFCYDYNNNSVTTSPTNPLNNWRAINGDFTYSNINSQNGINDIYLRANDRSYQSWAYNTIDFSGDWSQNGGNKCLCYDFRVFAGIPGKTSIPSSLYIFNGNSPEDANLMAFFSLSTAQDITDGWLTICPPLQFADGNGNLPSNAFGQWVMHGGGSANDWNNLLQNVSGIALNLDMHGGGPTEIYGYDNICMKSCPIEGPVYDFDPCCPPLNKKSIADLFTYVPTGSITSPYQMKFTPTNGFITQMQAYINYLNAINPSVKNLFFTWRIMDMGDGATPLTNYFGKKQIGGDVFNHFVPGGSTIANNTNFFPASLEINHWYKIHVGMYLNDGIEFFEKDCSNDTWFAFNFKIENQKLIGTYVDNHGKVLKSSEIFVGKKTNTIQKIQNPKIIKNRGN